MSMTEETLQNGDLSEYSMVMGTSAIIDTELDGVVGMYSGIYNNPFLFWGKYRKRISVTIYRYLFSFTIPRWMVPICRFLENLQMEIKRFN